MNRLAAATLVSATLAACALPFACSSGDPAKPDPAPLADGGPPPSTSYDANVPFFCDLPGSIRFDGKTKTTVPGASGLPDLSWVTPPKGFCVHYFGTVGNARSLRFAPGGELFVTSPTRGTTGGGSNGKNAILVLPDDDRDGLADTQKPFLSNLPATQGMAFDTRRGLFFYQDDQKLLAVPYKTGDRTPSATPAELTTISIYYSAIHWPRGIDIADDGTVYVTNGSDQGESCDQGHPFRGGVLALEETDGGVTPGGRPICKGFRNPIYLRCGRGHDKCFVTELTRDYSWKEGGREKLVPIREGDDWGYPCCATKDVPFPDVFPKPDCSGVAAEDVAFYVADTPMGFDFEPGRWPDPWKNRVVIAQHGQFGTWIGAKVVAVEMDTATGLPRNGGTLLPDGGQGNTGALIDFATGWDDGKLDHGRPADVTFAQDGRMFLADDNQGLVMWFAPVDLPKP